MNKEEIARRRLDAYFEKSNRDWHMAFKNGKASIMVTPDGHRVMIRDHRVRGLLNNHHTGKPTVLTLNDEGKDVTVESLCVWFDSELTRYTCPYWGS